jgi:hypothetical protein
MPMNPLVPHDQQALDAPLGGRRDRRWVAQVRLRAELDQFAEYAEAARLDARMVCAAKLADRAGGELVFTRDKFGQLAGGDPAVELDLRDIEKVLKLGYAQMLHNYLGRR